MIKKSRHILIMMTGAFLTWSLFGETSIIIPLMVALYSAAWLIAGRKKPMLSLAALPLNMAAVLAGLLSGSSVPESAFIFLLLLTAWETDKLYRDVEGSYVEGGEFRLLFPLFTRELTGSALVLIAYIITKDRDLSIGFWPPVLFTVLLIILLRKIFKAGNS